MRRDCTHVHYHRNMRVDGPGTASMTHRTRTVKVRKALTSAEHRVVLIIRTLAIQQKNSAAGDVATDRAMPKAPQRLTLRENAADPRFLNRHGTRHHRRRHRRGDVRDRHREHAFQRLRSQGDAGAPRQQVNRSHAGRETLHQLFMHLEHVSRQMSILTAVQRSMRPSR